jgi:hypothetical protein
MYLVCTSTYLLLLLSPALQDFEECCVMQTGWCQMPSNHLQILTWTGVIRDLWRSWQSDSPQLWCLGSIPTGGALKVWPWTFGSRTAWLIKIDWASVSQ